MSEIHSKFNACMHREYCKQIEKQRDELLAALIHIQQVACSGSPELGIATEAIASVKDNTQ